MASRNVACCPTLETPLWLGQEVGGWLWLWWLQLLLLLLLLLLLGVLLAARSWCHCLWWS